MKKEILATDRTPGLDAPTGWVFWLHPSGATKRPTLYFNHLTGCNQKTLFDQVQPKKTPNTGTTKRPNQNGYNQKTHAVGAVQPPGQGLLGNHRRLGGLSAAGDGDQPAQARRCTVDRMEHHGHRSGARGDQDARGGAAECHLDGLGIGEIHWTEGRSGAA